MRRLLPGTPNPRRLLAHPAARPHVQVTFDQGFTSLQDVSVHVGASLYEQLVVVPRANRHLRAALRWAQPVVLRIAAWIVVRMLFKSGRGGPHVGPQDRMDNLRKVRQLKGDFYVFWASDDAMIPANTSARVLNARYGRAEQGRNRITRVPGGHCCFFGEVPELAAKYADYLGQIGFLEQ